MKHRPPLLWILAASLLMALIPPLLVWLFSPHGTPEPLERFLPDRLSAALCLRQPRQAWQRHWTARQGPAPEDALQAIFEATDTWPRWLKKYGEVKARLRLKLYQEAFFRTVGAEAWLLFGEWGRGPAGTGQMGLVALIRGGNSVTARVGPLMDLVLEDYKIQRSACEGEPVYEYVDKRLARSLTFCQIGGWICVSLRQRDTGPLPAIIRQVKSGDGATTRSRVLALMPAAGKAAASTQTLSLGAAPALLLNQIDAFSTQRGRKLSKANRRSLAAWRRQLAGIDRVTLAQEGDSILDLQLEARGPRAAQLGGEFAPTAAKIGPPPENPSPTAAPDELAQIDLTLAAARQGAALAGFTWPELLQKLAGLELFLPGLRPRLEQSLAAEAPQSRGRIGLAAYAAPEALLPQLLFWSEAAAAPDPSASPARAHAVRSRAAAGGGGGVCQWLVPPGVQPPLPSPAAAGLSPWGRFADGVWAAQAAPPQGYLTLNFQGLAGELEKVPVVLMKKKKRKTIQRWKASFKALALAAGGAAARLDAAGDRLILTCRTP